MKDFTDDTIWLTKDQIEYSKKLYKKAFNEGVEAAAEIVDDESYPAISKSVRKLKK